MAENKAYTGKDIQLYHEGKLSPQEMHALERAALEDPFLAEALEGYQLSGSPDHDLADINQRLHKRVQKGETKRLLIWKQPWLRVAAIAMFILGAGWIMFYLNNKPSGELAREIKPIPGQAAPEVKAPAENALKQDDTINSNPQKEQKAVIPKETTPPASLAHHSKTRKSQEPAKGNVEAVTMAPVSAPTLTSSEALPKDMARSFKADTATFQTITGRITDTEGKPLAYSTIHIPQTNKTTQADANGNFSIQGKDSSTYVDIAAAGYNGKRALLRAETPNRIALEQNTGVLNEVVVMDARKSRKALPNRDSSQRVRIEELEPLEGAAVYDDYVLNYFRDKEINANEQGSVTLTFEVNAQGEPVNITVLSSDCPTCVEDAVKMVKEGPKWKKKKNKKAKITIRFDGSR